MDAVELLKQDHRAVEALFREFEEAGDQAYQTKRKLVEQISHELEVHTAIEEEIFYPAVQAKAPKEDREIVEEAYEEHHVVKVLLGELAGMEPDADGFDADGFDAKVTVLMENVRHHVEEEETELLPESEKLLGKERMDELGEKMARRKEQLESA
ncbi:MAG TPA: hemerythrin domain-containing protein [Actinomycetes bacterium]|nr:hemerythrin domain-containing protein [Actinomycetes bacterium]